MAGRTRASPPGDGSINNEATDLWTKRGSGSRLSPSLAPLLPPETVYSGSRRDPYYGAKHRPLTHEEAWRRNESRQDSARSQESCLCWVLFKQNRPNPSQSLLLAVLSGAKAPSACLPYIGCSIVIVFLRSSDSVTTDLTKLNTILSIQKRKQLRTQGREQLAGKKGS